uniref:VWFA domain-containing protein n=1 Tax=Eptatretus burgeri TaxID=7764 RepID=A0A8C4N9Q7_EPTBU
MFHALRGKSTWRVLQLSIVILWFYTGGGKQNKRLFIFSAVDVVFLLDGSRDIKQQDFDLMKQMVETIVGVLDVGQEKTQVGLVQYGGQPRSEFYLNTYRSNAEIFDAIQNIKLKGGQSNLRQGLEQLRRDQFIERRGGRAKDGAIQVAIILSGSTSVVDPTTAAKSLQEAGVNIFAMGAGKTDKNQLLRVGDTPTDNFVYYNEDYYALAHELSKVGSSLGDLIGVKIKIQVHTGGPDIVFLLDGSNDVGSRNFEHIRRLAAHITKSLKVAPEQTQVAVVQYGTTPHTEFNLISHKDQVNYIFHFVPIKQGRPRLGQALRSLLKEQFTEAAGSRKHLDNGVIILALGAGNAKRDELQLVGSTPAQKFVFFQRTFQQLFDEVLKRAQMMEEVFKISIDVQRDADVVFLLDGSRDISRNEFDDIKKMVQNIVRNLQIESNFVQVGVAQFGQQPRSEFYLNTHSTTRDMVIAIQNIEPLGGPAKLHEGLELLRREQFVERSGSRAKQDTNKVRQLSVRLIGGSQADALKSDGVKIFALGIGNAKVDQLYSIASKPPDVYSFYKPDILAIAHLCLQPFLFNCAILVLLRPTVGPDIIILLDGSSAVGPSNFASIRLLASEVIAGLDIGEETTHVAVVQYSSAPHTEFNLNKFMSKVITYRGGQSNLAGGLQHVLEKVMVKDKGSRIEDGAPQGVLILTGSSPNNLVAAKKASKALQEKRVKVMAVGAGRITERQLQEFVSDSADAMALYVGSSYRGIERLSTNLLSFVSTVVAKKADIVFLVDGSWSVGTNNFELVRDFLTDLVKGMIVGIDGVRIGLAQYSSDPQTEFLLNKFNTKDEVLDFINVWKYKGGNTLTGAAIEFITHNHFTEEAGSRKNENVPQVFGFQSQLSIGSPLICHLSLASEYIFVK